MAEPKTEPMSGPSNLIRLAFRRRPMPPSPVEQAAPFVLTAAEGRWSLRGTTAPLDATGLIAAADTLREIARALVEQARAEAGQPANPCLAEFVLHQDGGIDHWLTPGGDAADHRTIALGLRNAIGSLRPGG